CDSHDETPGGRPSFRRPAPGAGGLRAAAAPGDNARSASPAADAARRSGKRYDRMTQPTTELAGPAWDLTGEYDGPASAGIENDLRRIEALLAEIESLNAGLAASPESP